MTCRRVPKGCGSTPQVPFVPLARRAARQLSGHQSQLHTFHEFWPIVPDVADLGSDLPSLDLSGIGFRHRRGLFRRATHPIIELCVVEHDRHSVVILRTLGAASVGGIGLPAIEPA